jgi:hypothetical protein
MTKEYKMTDEHRKKISLALTGRKLSSEHSKKMGLTKLGNKNMLGKHHTLESKNKMSSTKKGMIWSEEVCKQRSLFRIGKVSFMLGKKQTESTRLKMSEQKKGNKHWNWQGGKTSKKREIRNSFEYKLWRESVFKRDNFTCQNCTQNGGKLCSHHINNFAEFPELRFAIDNGITLCENCHKKFHLEYSWKHNTREQLLKFLNKI